MDEAIRDHWSGRAEGYSRLVRSRQDSEREKSAWARLYSEALEGCSGKALDCGCGPGTAAMRVRALGFEVTGMDFSESMIDEARANAEHYGMDIGFVQGDAEDMPFPDGSFDVIVSQYMLWTVPHPDKVIEEWFRVLRPGGRVAYVDGVWSGGRHDTAYGRAVMKACRALSRNEAMKNSVSSSVTVSRISGESLWSLKADHPADDLRMLEAAGFVGMKVIDDVARRVNSKIDYYAFTYKDDYFMIIAEKPRMARSQSTCGRP